MKKQLKIILIVAIAIIVLLIASLVIFLVIKNNDNKLKQMNFEFTLDNIERSNYVANDEFGKMINISDAIKGEQFLDETLGIYNISLVSDGQNTTLKYTVKNHDNKKRDAFSYKLMFTDDSGVILDSVNLESKAIPPLATYDVNINITGDIVGIYSIIPSLVLEEVGNIGGVIYENY